MLQKSIVINQNIAYSAVKGHGSIKMCSFKPIEVILDKSICHVWNNALLMRCEKPDHMIS